MNTALAKNVKAIRDAKHWTQQHLADTAGILLRTVQRVEKGDGASVDTLGALANAFDVSIDVLQTDVDALMDQYRLAEQALRQTHYFVDVAPVSCSAHLELVGGSDAYFTHCACDGDVLRDAFASLNADLRDMGDLWDDVEPIRHREWVKGAYEQVKVINRLGAVISIGKANRTLRVGAGSAELRTLFVIAWPKGQEKGMIAIEKDP